MANNAREPGRETWPFNRKGGIGLGTREERKANPKVGAHKLRLL